MIIIQILREEEYFFPKMVNDEIKGVTPYVAYTPLFESLEYAERLAHTLLQHRIIKDTDEVSFIRVDKVKVGID